jgi:hypothetical protein
MQKLNNNLLLFLMLLIYLCSLDACQKQHKDLYSNSINQTNNESNNLSNLNKYLWLSEEKKIKYRIRDIKTPPGYNRIKINNGSFAEWLRYLPLKPKNTPVYLYNGKRKDNQKAHYRVIYIDTGDKDLQQCTDAIIRLSAEYLYSTKQYEEIHFNFVNGFNAEYSRWQNGYRIKVKNNNTWWEKIAEYNSDYKTFREYLDTVFNYANSFSLEKELIKVENINEIKVGNLFIQGGFPGHAVIVVDIAKNKSGNIVFLLAQSYMPAQDMHILKSPFKFSPWYDINIGRELKTPEWIFKRTDLKRFRN